MMTESRDNCCTLRKNWLEKHEDDENFILFLRKVKLNSYLKSVSCYKAVLVSSTEISDC